MGRIDGRKIGLVEFEESWYGVTIAANFADPVSNVVFQVVASKSFSCSPQDYGEELGLVIDDLTNEVHRCQDAEGKITEWLPPIIIKL
jgi:hypothetical protein